MNKIRGLFAALMLVLCIAVSSDVLAAGTAMDLPPATGQTLPWDLTYHIHGGFAGLRQKLELNALGELKVTNEKDYKIIHRMLPERRVKEFTALLDSLRTVKPGAPTESLCRDCVRHDLTFAWQGETHTYRYQTGDTLAEELDAVLSALGQYLQKADSPM